MENPDIWDEESGLVSQQKVSLFYPRKWSF